MIVPMSNPLLDKEYKQKKAFNPILGACANGSLAIKAKSKVAIADATAVAVNNAPLSIPESARIDGFTARM